MPALRRVRVCGKTVTGRVAMVIDADGLLIGELVTLSPDTTVNKVEVLR